MKTTDANVLIVPGYKGAGPLHWQSRWEAKLSAAQRVRMGDWHKPVFQEWKENLLHSVSQCDKPVLFIGHSIGAQMIVHCADEFSSKIAGAMLVAPPDVENRSIRPRHLQTFGPARTAPLPFPSVTIASRNDPFCSFEKAEEMAASWGSLFMDAGESGHLNHESGHGPWPEGLMVFGKFIAKL